MPPTITNGKSAYSTSAPRKSPPTSPSIFDIPEKTSRSGVSPPRYGTQNTNNSSSSSSWEGEEESPPKYGEQKTTDSSKRSSTFSNEDSSPPSFSTSFHHRVDSVILFGHGKFKSPCSAPKPSCPLESKISKRPPQSPGPRTLPADRERDRLHKYHLYRQTLKSTPQRESPGPSEQPALYKHKPSVDVSADSAQSGNRQLRYSDSSDILTPSTPTTHSARTPSTPTTHSARTPSTPTTHSARQEHVQTGFTPRSWRQFDPRQSPRQQFPRQQTPRQQTPRQQTPRQQTPRQQTPRQQTPYSGRKTGTSPGSSSEKHDTYFIETPASEIRWRPPPFSGRIPEYDRRKPRYPPSDTKDIIPPSSSGTLPSTEYLENQPSKSAPEKKHRKLGITAFRRQPRTIKKLCCNIAREFSNREPATHFRQKYSGKQLPDSRKQPLRTLAASTFNSFISQPDLVGVMFHNSTTNKPGTLEDWTIHSKSNSGANQLFASVDCAKEASLCASEGVSSLPFYKLYSKGSTVKAVKDLGRL